MRIADLRGYNFEFNNTHYINDEEFIFGNTLKENKRYKRYFYKYNIYKRSIVKINKKGLLTTDDCRHSSLLRDDYIYTNLREFLGGYVKTILSRINIVTGAVELIAAIEGDFSVYFLSDSYAFLWENRLEFHQEDFDFQKDIQGDYVKLYLYDINNCARYKVLDKRLFLGLRNEIISYEHEGRNFILFQESYMEEWEKEENYKKGVNKEDYYREGYKEGIYTISMDSFISAIKNGLKNIPMKPLKLAEEKGVARYLSMDTENIYYRVKDFTKEIQYFYRTRKSDNKTDLIKKLKISKCNNVYYLCFQCPANGIYEFKQEDNNRIYINEIISEKPIYEGSGYRETFEAIIENNLILSFWTEDDRGKDYQDFIKIIDLKSEKTTIYKGTADIQKNTLVIYS